MLLTDEEIEISLANYLNSGDVSERSHYGKWVAKAQSKNFVDMLKERHVATENNSEVFVLGTELWQALLEEVSE